MMFGKRQAARKARLASPVGFLRRIVENPMACAEIGTSQVAFY